MASMGGGHLSGQQLVSRIKEGKLLNKSLMDICKVEALKTGGNKHELQARIIACKFADISVQLPFSLDELTLPYFFRYQPFR